MSTTILSHPFGRFNAGRLHIGLGRLAQALWARWQYAREVRATQRTLAQMDDHMLQDLGVSRAQAAFELDHALDWRRAK